MNFELLAYHFRGLERSLSSATGRHLAD